MIFRAILKERSPRGHYFLEDVVADNGLRRSHCWLNASYVRLPPTTMPISIVLDAKYRRYRPGPDGWTITRVRNVQYEEEVE